MAIKYISYDPQPLQGQAVLNCFRRTRRMLSYQGDDALETHIERGMPLYEVQRMEQVNGGSSDNLLLRGECLSVCAYLKEKGITIDLVYIDPPFASGADYAKKVFLRKNPKVAEIIQEEIEDESLGFDELKTFEEKMYGDFWEKERYLNWMYENLLAIKSILSDNASIYVHLDYRMSHYVKLLMDEIFGEINFKNEITWNSTASHNDTVASYSQIKNSILFYTLGNVNTFNTQYTDYSEEYITSEWKKTPSGRYYKSENMLDPQNKMSAYDFHGTTARWRTVPDKFEELWNAPQTDVPNSHGRIKLGRNGKPIKRCRIVFLDELPWMDTPKSNFKSALDYFWNSYASKHKDIVLIVCGSATSWILNNLLNSKTGFYNRVTKKILLEPFTLKETYEYLLSRGFQYTKQTVIDAYMVFGGVPFYLEMLSPRLSLDQNIEKLCFEEKGDLHYELNNLFKSLFKNHNKHLEVILSLSKVKSGITRQQIIEKTKINGQTLTDILLELEQCSFIRKFTNFTMQKNGSFYQIIDPFILFSLKFDFANKKISWLSFINSSGYYSWCGLAFEKVCLNNINSIKMALGISSIETEVFSWRSKNSETGAQIDLVIDRGDRTINICEMKHSISAFEIDKKYADNLLNKRSVFINETKTNKSVQISLFTVNGLKKNQYSNIVQNSFDCDSLFLI